MTDGRTPRRTVLLRTAPVALAVMLGFGIMPAIPQVHDGSLAAEKAAASDPRGLQARALQFQAMAQGQSPDRLFITCSDSRLVPSQITGTGVGELGVSATVEYAVAALEVPTIVVCGHTRCGAMKAALDPIGLDTVPNVRNWIKFAEPARLALDELHPHLGPVARWVQLVELNVLQQLTNLKTHPWVAARVASGRLQLEGWVYELEGGQVRRITP